MTKTIDPGWRQVAIAMLAQAVNAGSIFSAYSVIAAPLKIEFAPSNMVLMLGITATSLVSGLLSPSLGTAVDRFSVRKLMLIGAGLMASGFLLMSVSTSMFQVVAIYAVFMAAASVVLGPIATSALLARWFTHRRGLAMGIAASGSAIGGLLIPPLLQGLIDGLEWRMALQVFSAVIVFVTLPLFAWLVVDRPQQPPRAGAAHEPITPKQGRSISSGEALRDIRFWLIALPLGTVFCGSIGIMSNLIQIVGEKGIGPSQGAFLISIYAGANLVGKLVLAGAADRFDHRLMLVIMLTGIGAGVSVLLHAGSYSMLAAACAIAGAFSGGASPLWSVILAHVYGPERIGGVMGLMTLVIMPFTLLAPPVFGGVYDITGSYDNALVGYSGIIVVALLLVSQLRIGGSDRAGAYATSQ